MFQEALPKRAVRMLWTRVDAGDRNMVALRNFLGDDDGTTAVEYGVMLALILGGPAGPLKSTARGPRNSSKYMSSMFQLHFIVPQVCFLRLSNCFVVPPTKKHLGR